MRPYRQLVGDYLASIPDGATFTIEDIERSIQGRTRPSTPQIAAILRTTDGVRMVGSRRPGIPSIYQKEVRP